MSKKEKRKPQGYERDPHGVLRGLVGGLQYMVDWASKSDEEFDAMQEKFSNSDGTPLHLAQFAQYIYEVRLIKDRSFSENQVHGNTEYHTGALSAGATVNLISEGIATKARKYATLVTPYQSKKFGDPQVFMDQVNTMLTSIKETVDEDAPLKLTREDYATMGNPLTAEDIAKLDTIFKAPEKPEEVAYAFIMATYMYTTDRYLSSARAFCTMIEPIMGIGNAVYTSMETTVRIMKEYFAYWKEKAYANFYTNDAQAEDIFADLPLLGVVLAVSEAQETTILPKNFNKLLQGGMFGTLDDQTREVLEGIYQEEFDSRFNGKIKREKIFTQYDDDGYEPYTQAHETAVHQQQALLHQLAPFGQVGEEASQKIRENFPSIQKSLNGIIHSIAHFGEVTCDVSTYNENMLDIFFIHDETAVNLQMDKQGRIYGLPEGMTPEEAQPLLEAAAKALVVYAKEKLHLFQETKSKQTLSLPERRPVSAQQPVVSAVSARESIQLPRQLKRKELRRQGLLGEGNGNGKTEPVKEVAKPTKKYEITFTDDFRKELAALPQDVQEQAKEVIRLIEWDKKPLLRLIMREVDTNMYRIRFGKYRMAFAELATDKLAAVKIDKRSDVYLDLKQQIYTILAKLD